MFCTNCGTKLPDNAKFCPNCGATIVGTDTAQEAAVQIAEAAAETAQVVTETVDAAKAGTEAVAEEVFSQSQEAVQTVLDAVLPVVPETEGIEVTREMTEIPEPETDPEPVEAVISETAAGPEETAADAAAEIVQVQEEAVEAAETAGAEYSAAAEEAVQAVTDAIQPVIPEVPVFTEETAAPAEPVIPAAETVPYTAPAVIFGNETAPAVDAAAPVQGTPFVQPQENPPFNPYVQQQEIPQPVVPQPVVPQNANSPAVPQKAGKKKGKGIIAALLAVLVLAGAFLVYWNLPGTKVGRYLKEAVSAQESGDYLKAGELYHKVLELRPDDQQSSDALISMYEEVEYDSVGYENEGKYEEALEAVRLMFALLPEEEENNEYALYDVYYNWVMDEASKGNFDTVETIVDRAEAELNSDYASDISNAAADMRETVLLQNELMQAAKTIINCNKTKDYKGAFGALMDEVDCLRRYAELGNDLPFFALEADDYGVGFYYNRDRDAVQAYVGGLLDGYVEHGAADTYYVSDVSGSRQYEFFYADNWYAGRPGGNFYEINFKTEPDEPTNENSDYVSGFLKDGKYDGEVANSKNGKTYYMQFVYGTVQVLDTVDPNGDSGNVVGYTEDKNGWITFKDSGLTGSYGVRYLT